MRPHSQRSQEDGHIGTCVRQEAEAGANDARIEPLNNAESMRVAGFEGVAENAAPVAGPLYDLNKVHADSSNVDKMSFS